MEKHTKETKLQNCSFIKTILLYLVILYHSCVFWTGTWWDSDPIFPSMIHDILARWLNSFHIYAFTLVSGYIFSYKVHGGAYQTFQPFLLNKTKRLLVPYVFVMATWVAPISILLFNWDWGYVAKKFLLAIDPSQLWFLWMLFGVFTIVWPMRKLLLKRPLAGWIISLVLYGIGLIGRHFIPNVFCVWTSCQYVLFFFIGMRIRDKEEKREKLITEAIPWYCWIILDLLLFAGTIVIARNSGFVWSLIAVILNIILHLVGAIMAWTFLQFLADIANWKNSKLFITLSSLSMPMYLFHQQIIYFTIVWLNGKVNPWINAGVNFVGALIGSLLISLIVMHWKTTRFLVGEK